MEYSYKIQEINKITKLLENKTLASPINTKQIDILLKNYVEKKPIPLVNYTKILQLINESDKNCSLCSKNAQYKYNNKLYCWIHAHTLD
jgi:hypothetical protein